MTGRWKPSRLLLFWHCYCLHCFFPMRLQASCLIHLLYKSLSFTSQQHVNVFKLITFQPCTHPLSLHAKVLCQPRNWHWSRAIIQTYVCKRLCQGCFNMKCNCGLLLYFEHNLVMFSSCLWHRQDYSRVTVECTWEAHEIRVSNKTYFKMNLLGFFVNNKSKWSNIFRVCGNKYGIHKFHHNDINKTILFIYNTQIFLYKIIYINIYIIVQQPKVILKCILTAYTLLAL